MKLSNVFTKGVVTVGLDATLAAVAAKMHGHNVGAVVVEEKQRPVGIITDRDIAIALGANNVSTQTAVRQVMTRHVLAIPDDTSIVAATKFMRDRQVRRLPIVDQDDHLVGMVTLDDLLRHLGHEIANLADGIRSEMECIPGTTKGAAPPHDLDPQC